MPVGLEVYSDTGVLQLGAETTPFTLRYTVSVNVAAFGGGFEFQINRGSFTLPTGLNTPLIALRPPAGRTAFVSFSVYDSGREVMIEADAPCTVEVYVFDFTPVSAPANFGLEVRSAAGAILYNSGYTAPMKVVGFSANVTSLPSGRIYAGITTGLFRTLWFDSGHNSTLFTAEGVIITSTSVAVKRLYKKATSFGEGLTTYEYVNPIASDPNALRASVIAVDVTDLVAV